MTKAQRIQAARAALASGNYMLRRSNAGMSSFGQFKWQPVGEWTEAPDWDPQPVCGGGLHGNHPDKGWAYWTDGPDLDFCETDPAAGLVEMKDKIKVRRARVLLWNDLSTLDGLTVKGNLCLGGCTGLTALPNGLTVKGYLELDRCTSLSLLPDRLAVDGYIDLHYCSGLCSFPDGLTVNSGLDLGGCTKLVSLPEGLTVNGNLYLDDCHELASLPEGLTVQDNLYLDGCYKLVSLPKGIKVYGVVYGRSCSSALHADMNAKGITCY